jgi:hypothetical protein
MSGPLKKFNFKRLKRRKLTTRRSLVELGQMARPHIPGSGFRDFMASLPDQLAARDLKAVAAAIAGARRNGRPVHIAMGAHALKVGLAPVLIDLVSRKIITAVSVNGAVMVHDYECALAGKTSEDVAEALDDGSFGMTVETGRGLARFVEEGARDGLGLAQAVGRGIARSGAPYKSASLLARCYETSTPATAHVAIGTDVSHLAPELDFAKLGELCGRDFAAFIELVRTLDGGVYINLGSAVVMPEVFLKAVSAARNVGSPLKNMTTVNMDFNRHYRPMTNVVTRPTKAGGKGFHLTGHHEILLPLLAAAVLEDLEKID